MVDITYEDANVPENNQKPLNENRPTQRVHHHVRLRHRRRGLQEVDLQAFERRAAAALRFVSHPSPCRGLPHDAHLFRVPACTEKALELTGVMCV